MGGILSLITNVFGAVGKVFGFLEKKNLENNIRKGYEEEKKADALEEDKTAKEKVEKAEKQADEAKEAVRAVRDADIKDAELTEQEEKAVLDGIEDFEEKEKRAKQIKAARELKEKVEAQKKKVETNESFNNGDEISFGG